MVDVRYQASYSQDADFVWDALTDEAFLSSYATKIGALQADVGVERTADYTRTRVQMTVPTAGVPAAFKRFVTPTVDITEIRTWPTGGNRFKGDVTVDAAVGKREVHIRGGVMLMPESEGCQFVFDGGIAVKLRLVGDAAAVLIRDLVKRVLTQQGKVLQDWKG
jgi:hypothetical protein